MGRQLVVYRASVTGRLLVVCRGFPMAPLLAVCPGSLTALLRTAALACGVVTPSSVKAGAVGVSWGRTGRPPGNPVSRCPGSGRRLPVIPGRGGRLPVIPGAGGG